MKFLLTVLVSVLLAVFANGKLHQLQSSEYVDAYEQCSSKRGTNDDIDTVYTCAHSKLSVRVLTWILSDEIQDGH